MATGAGLLMCQTCAVALVVGSGSVTETDLGSPFSSRSLLASSSLFASCNHQNTMKMLDWCHELINGMQWCWSGQALSCKVGEIMEGVLVMWLPRVPGSSDVLLITNSLSSWNEIMSQYGSTEIKSQYGSTAIRLVRCHAEIFMFCSHFKLLQLIYSLKPWSDRTDNDNDNNTDNDNDKNHSCESSQTTTISLS